MKILIIGNSGSGKSWLAKRLAECHGLPLIHLDDLFWQPGGFDQPRSEAEQARLLAEASCQATWIAEGVFGRLAAQVLQQADHLVWLDLEWSVCVKRLRHRAAEAPMHQGRRQTENGLAKLLAWAGAYDTRGDDCSRTAHTQLFEHFRGTRHHLRTEAEVMTFADELDLLHQGS